MNSSNEKYSFLLLDQGEFDIEKILNEYISDKTTANNVMFCFLPLQLMR